MAEVLLHVLGSYSDAESRADMDRAWGAGDPGACLLLGEESRGRSSLLFLAAAEAAGRGGRRVLFLAPSPVQALPAPLLPLEPGSLRRIEFAYPRTADGLLQALATVHRAARGGLPSLLLVDGLDRYLQGGGQETAQRAARVAALLRDSAGWLSQQQQPGARCHIIAALKAPIPEETASDSFLPIIERYFPVKCMVREEQCEPEGVQRYLISFSGLATPDAEVPPESQNVEDCTWELLFEADKVTGIHLVARCSELLD
ncbi:ATPase SWSAP1 isoform X2 [Chiloscyllium plagiosum]|uniref:ATPase SWSAP1 isoform X2 n=1 Tax=Chiloscyllium plagiosum TaxID=36176 RepID=UPI001CB7F51B|nr:ATPase SWSAP1 isoform X2 [Chiloscyllium plagiosum]